MSRQMIRKTIVAVFGGAMMLSGPTVPAVAQSGGYCYDDILYCKYHSRYYDSFQDCLEQNKSMFCPSSRAASMNPISFVVERNVLKKDHI